MKPARLRADVLAGLTTSFALVPECIAFALVAHLNPSWACTVLSSSVP